MAETNGHAGVWNGTQTNAMQFMLSGLNAAAQSYAPVCKAIAQANLEIMGLANRRAQAVLEMPSRMLACRTPQEAMSEQVRFWQTATSQMTESSRKMTAIWTAAVPALPTMAFGMFGNGTAPRERDYITFPEPKSSESSRDSRRAA